MTTRLPPPAGVSKALVVTVIVLLLGLAGGAYWFLVVLNPLVSKPDPIPPPTTMEQPKGRLDKPPIDPVKTGTEPVLTGIADPKVEPLKPGTSEVPPGRGPLGQGDPATAGGVEVTSEPTGARIELGGKFLGTTPQRLPALEGGKSVELKLKMRGYQDVRQKLKPPVSDSKPLAFRLSPIERLVEINCAQRGADVYLDGRRVGRTPYIFKKFDFSKVHQVEVRRAGFTPWTHNVSDAEAFVLKNKREVLVLNAVLESGSASKRPGGRGKKLIEALPPSSGSSVREGASPPETQPAEAPKPNEAAKSVEPTPIF